MNGLLVVDKEAGWTSHDVVARCRRILSERRVGHAGTLDPDATGRPPRGRRPRHAAAALPHAARQDLPGRGRARDGHRHPRRLGRGDRDLRHGATSRWPTVRAAAARAHRATSSRCRRWSRRSRSAASASTSWPGRAERSSARPRRVDVTRFVVEHGRRRRRVPHRGRLLGRHLRPLAGGRPRDGARRRGAPARRCGAAPSAPSARPTPTRWASSSRRQVRPRAPTTPSCCRRPRRSATSSASRSTARWRRLVRARAPPRPGLARGRGGRALGAGRPGGPAGRRLRGHRHRPGPAERGAGRRRVSGRAPGGGSGQPAGSV